MNFRSNGFNLVLFLISESSKRFTQSLLSFKGVASSFSIDRFSQPIGTFLFFFDRFSQPIITATWLWESTQTPPRSQLTSSTWTHRHGKAIHLKMITIVTLTRWQKPEWMSRNLLLSFMVNKSTQAEWFATSCMGKQCSFCCFMKISPFSTLFQLFLSDVCLGCLDCRVKVLQLASKELYITEEGWRESFFDFEIFLFLRVFANLNYWGDWKGLASGFCKTSNARHLFSANLVFRRMINWKGTKRNDECASIPSVNTLH